MAIAIITCSKCRNRMVLPKKDLDADLQLICDLQAAQLEAAWGIIANAYGGDWSQASPEWREAAGRWRDEYQKNDEGQPPRTVDRTITTEPNPRSAAPDGYVP